MIKRLFASVAAVCALAIATVAFAQVTPIVAAPATTMVPSTGVAFGAQGASATFVDRTHVLPAGRPDIAATGTIAAGTPNAAYTVAIDGNGVAAFKLAGLTASGATLTLEGSYDGGTTWAAINGVSGGTGILATTYTADGNFTAATGGRTGVRLRVSSTGSGTITVASNLSGVSTDIRMSSPLPPGSNTIGGVTLTRTATFVPGQVKIAVTGTRVALPSGTVSTVIVTALSTNTAPIVVGTSSVANTSDGTGNGYILEAGSSIAINVAQASAINVTGTAGDIASYMGSQ